MYKRLLIIGGTGSLGTKLIEKYQKTFEEKYVMSRDEYKQWVLKQKFPSTNFVLGDIGTFKDVQKALKDIQPTIIIVASALKHIDRCETNVEKCLNTNVVGLLNVLNVAEDMSCIHKILFVSTDKACEPVTIYGMSKSIAEHVIQHHKWKGKAILLAVRYGNVINSNGSVVPIFQQQAKNGDFITITDTRMTRFYMTLDQSVYLITNALEQGKDRDIWVPNLPSMYIKDLAEIFSEKYNKPIKIIGLRCQEKTHEVMLSKGESVDVYDIPFKTIRRYIVREKGNTNLELSSADKIIDKETLRKMLEKDGLL